MKNDNFVTTQKAAEILGISVSTIYRMIEKGTLEPFKTPGGQRRFSVEKLEAFKEISKNILAPQNPSKIKDSQEKYFFENNVQNIKKTVDKRNSLNDLTGTEWLPETKSFFIKKD